MRVKIILSLIFFLIVVVLLIIYWFIPSGTIDYILSPERSSNFTLDDYGSEDMQFYENMRYPNKEISYLIQNCTLKKKDDMERAFEMIENETIISFYSVSSNEEISVSCDSYNRIEEGLFIAGEGGPTNITQSTLFNVIHDGSILLIRESKCENPNVALHELLHALGFDHSENRYNVMYPISKCNQEIGQDTIDLINQLYAFPSQPDLGFENVSASMSGRYLDVNMTIRNNGLAESDAAEIIIYADDKQVKKIEFDGLGIGHGRAIILTNILVMQTSVERLNLSIDHDPEELDKNNNYITLEIKK